MNDFIKVFNSILTKLYSSIENDGLNLIEKIGNIDRSIFDNLPLNIIYSEIVIETIRLILICIIFSFICFYSIRKILFIYTDNTINFPYSFIIKFIVVIILSSNSYEICKQIVIVNEIITESIEHITSEFTDEKVEYSNLVESVDTLEEYFALQDKLNVNGIKESIICGFTISMIVILSIRYVLIIICIYISPFCFIFAVDEKTKFIFKIWLKVYILNLIIQNINKLLIFICIISKDEKSIASTIVIGAIILIYKLNKKVGDVTVWRK